MNMWSKYDNGDMTFLFRFTMYSTEYHNNAIKKLCRICASVIGVNDGKDIYYTAELKEKIQDSLRTEVSPHDPDYVCSKCYNGIHFRGTVPYKKHMWPQHHDMDCDTCTIFSRNIGGGRPIKKNGKAERLTFVYNEEFNKYEHMENFEAAHNQYFYNCGCCGHILTPLSVLLKCEHLQCLTCATVRNENIKCGKCAYNSHVNDVSKCPDILHSFLENYAIKCKQCGQHMTMKNTVNHVCEPTHTSLTFKDFHQPSDLNEQKMKEVRVILLQWLSHMGTEKGMVKLKGPKGHVSIWKSILLVPTTKVNLSLQCIELHFQLLYTIY